MILASLIAAALQVAAPEPASTSLQAPAPVVIPARWAQGPQMIYPRAAQHAGSPPGRVQLTCTVKTDGRLRDCQVTGEDPPGYGFAEAALSGVRVARFTPRTVDGVATEQAVSFPVNFQIK